MNRVNLCNKLENIKQQLEVLTIQIQEQERASRRTIEISDTAKILHHYRNRKGIVVKYQCKLLKKFYLQVIRGESK